MINRNKALASQYDTLGKKKQEYLNLANGEKRERAILMQELADSKESSANTILKLKNTKTDWDNRKRYAKESLQKAKKSKNKRAIADAQETIWDCDEKKRGIDFKIAEANKSIKQWNDGKKREIEITKKTETQYKEKASKIEARRKEIKKEHNLLERQYNKIIKLPTID